MKKQLALYEELLDDEGAIIEQNPVVVVIKNEPAAAEVEAPATQPVGAGAEK